MFAVSKIEGDRVVGSLNNDPVYATYMTRDEEYRLPVSQISGFELFLDEDNYTPATINELDIVTLRTGWREEE